MSSFITEGLTVVGLRVGAAIAIAAVGSLYPLLGKAGRILARRVRIPPLIKKLPLKELEERLRGSVVWGSRGTAIAYLVGVEVIAIKLLIIKLSIDGLIFFEEWIADLILQSTPEKSRQRMGTLIPAILVATKWVTVIIGAIACLYAVGLNPQPLLGGAGILTLILGFGARSILKDLYSGLFILFEDYYRIGDLVEVDGFTGAIDRLSLRSTYLKARNGDIKIVPNGAIASLIKRFALYNDLFITYSRKDREFVERLHYSLKKSGHDAWVDFEDIPVGEEWEKAIMSAIAKANYALIVLSPDYLSSEVCSREFVLIRANPKIKIIPIVCRDVVSKDTHPVIARQNWLFFRESDSFDGSFRKLLKVINNLSEF